MSRFAIALLIAVLPAALAGCDLLGIDSPEKIAALRVAEGHAVGGACRHAGHALEDCFVANKKSDKAAIFTGWRDMNDYMREHQIAVVLPRLNMASSSTALTDDDGIVIVARAAATNAPVKPAATPLR